MPREISSPPATGIIRELREAQTQIDETLSALRLGTVPLVPLSRAIRLLLEARSRLLPPPVPPKP